MAEVSEYKEEISRLKKELKRVRAELDAFKAAKVHEPDVSQYVQTDNYDNDELGSFNDEDDDKENEHDGYVTYHREELYCNYFADGGPVETKQKNDKFIFHANDIKMEKVLGSGNFATTSVGIIKATNEKIAVKNLKDGVDMNDYKIEMRNLLNVGDHPNVMKFIGIMPLDGSQCFLTEFCELGSLDQMHSEYNLRDKKIFFRIARGLFCGVGHLHANNMIHRDIACRNILVRKGFDIVISDFGLTVSAPCDEYRARSNEMIPWPWMPPEALKTGVFRSSSDVWAVGVTLWELLMKGKRPYSDSKGKFCTYKDVKDAIIARKLTLETPPPSYEWSRDILDCCFHPKPEGRPRLSRETWLDFVAAQDGAESWGLFTDKEVESRFAQALEIVEQKSDDLKAEDTKLSNVSSKISALKIRISKWRKSSLNMIKSYARPPKPLKLVFEAICIVLGQSPKSSASPSPSSSSSLGIEPTWKAAQLKLKFGDRFKSELVSYDIDKISPNIIKALRPYVEGEDGKKIDPKQCQFVADIGSDLAEWVVTLYNYHFALKDPKGLASKKYESISSTNDGDTNGMWPRLNQLSKVRAAKFSNGGVHVLRSPIKAFKSLIELHLDNNHITSLPSDIQHLRELKILNLNDNFIEYVSPAIKHLVNLEKLYLRNNHLSSLPVEFLHLINLQKLYLQKNELTVLPSGIGSLINLQKLYLEDNKLISIPHEIKSLSKLIWLRAENNNLTSLTPEIGHLRCIQVLSLDGNQLSELPSQIKFLENLSELSLSKNNLTKIQPEIFSSLAKLKFLLLDDNPVMDLCAEMKSLTQNVASANAKKKLQDLMRAKVN